MPTATVDERLRELLARLHGVQQTDDTQWEALCPTHEDGRPSLCVGVLGTNGIGVCCQAGCETSAVMAAIDLPMSHLQPPRDRPGNKFSGTIVQTYDYHDTNGSIVFQVVRFEPKDFRQRKPDGKGGWDWSVKGIQQVPYRLPSIVAADPSTTIFIVEGEKDADRLSALGIIATCNAGGAAKANPKNPKPLCKWKKSHSEWFVGRQVAIIPDNDDPGRDHSLGIARSLNGVATSIKILHLPELPPKGDVSDWLAAGGTPNRLLELAAECSPWTPPLDDKTKSTIDSISRMPWCGSGLTDRGNGERFAAMHGTTVRYCFAWKSWLVWDGTRWQLDNMGEIDRKAKEAAKSIYIEAAKADTQPESKEIAKWAEKSESRAGLRSMLDLARSEQPIPVAVGSLDSEAWLLNCENGTIDLLTGNLREHHQEDFITKRCPVEYPVDSPQQPAIWLEFLDRIFAGNEELISFVRRIMGMSLVGEVRDHVLPIFWGTGQNGKSTLVETWCGLLGDDYSMKAPAGFLMAKKSDSHPTELADLHGKRLVSAIETSENGRLSESLVKELTGGDTIRARRMREDFWQFQPSHTVILATNHKPTIKGSDFGIWRRVCLIPFIVTIPEQEKDEQLKDKLKKEWPLILKWSVEGCLDWQKNGLRPPEDVNVATAEYRGDSDLLADFIDECCLIGDYRVKASVIYDTYRKWAESNGEYVESQKKFGGRLTERGFTRKKSASVNWWLGITNREVGEHSNSELQDSQDA